MQKTDNILPESSSAGVLQASDSGRAGAEVLYFPCERRGMVHFLSFALGSHTSALGGLCGSQDTLLIQPTEGFCANQIIILELLHIFVYIRVRCLLFLEARNPQEHLVGFQWKTTLLHTNDFR